jgi:hypothetical protein
MCSDRAGARCFELPSTWGDSWAPIDYGLGYVAESRLLSRFTTRSRVYPFPPANLCSARAHPWASWSRLLVSARSESRPVRLRRDPGGGCASRPRRRSPGARRPPRPVVGAVRLERGMGPGYPGADRVDQAANEFVVVSSPRRSIVSCRAGDRVMADERSMSSCADSIATSSPTSAISGCCSTPPVSPAIPIRSADLRIPNRLDVSKPTAEATANCVIPSCSRRVRAYKPRVGEPQRRLTDRNHNGNNTGNFPGDKPRAERDRTGRLGCRTCRPHAANRCGCSLAPSTTPGCPWSQVVSQTRAALNVLPQQTAGVRGLIPVEYHARG